MSGAELPFLAERVVVETSDQQRSREQFGQERDDREYLDKEFPVEKRSDLRMRAEKGGEVDDFMNEEFLARVAFGYVFLDGVEGEVVKRNLEEKFGTEKVERAVEVGKRESLRALEIMSKVKSGEYFGSVRGQGGDFEEKVGNDEGILRRAGEVSGMLPSLSGEAFQLYSNCATLVGKDNARELTIAILSRGRMNEESRKMRERLLTTEEKEEIANWRERGAGEAKEREVEFVVGGLAVPDEVLVRFWDARRKSVDRKYNAVTGKQFNDAERENWLKGKEKAEKYLRGLEESDPTAFAYLNQLESQGNLKGMVAEVVERDKRVRQAKIDLFRLELSRKPGQNVRRPVEAFTDEEANLTALSPSPEDLDRLKASEESNMALVAADERRRDDISARNVVLKRLGVREAMSAAEKMAKKG